MGMRLSPAPFPAAGLPAPRLRYEAAIGAGPEWAGYEVLTGVVRDLLPLLQKFGIATTEDIRIETLAARLREEVRQVQEGSHDSRHSSGLDSHRGRKIGGDRAGGKN